MASAGFRDFVDVMEREREAFLTGRDRPGQVRKEILTSWRRSSLCGVDPGVDGLPYREEIDLESRLYAAASPVLTRLAERLIDTSTAVLLANRDARIVARWASDNQLLRMMDRTESAPGFSLSEEICGTNGLGSVVEEKRPLYVMGPEHFADRFTLYACYGAPILHPITGRVEGVLTLVCNIDHASPLMMPFVEETSEAIVHRLREAVSWQDRYLLDTFGQAVRRKRRAILALNENTIIASPVASRLLDSADHAVLWESAAHAIVQRHRTNEVICLQSGRTVRMHAEPVVDGDRVVGALVELEPLSEGEVEAVDSGAGRRNGGPDRQLLDRLGGNSAAWLQTIRAAGHAVRSDEPVMVSGDSGVGKLSLARAMHHVSGRSGELRVLNAGLVAVDGLSVWLGHLRAALAEPGTLVLRRLDALEPEGATALAGLLDEHREQHPHGEGPRIVGLLTTDPNGPPPWGPHTERIGVHRIVVPPLRERAEDIPELVGRLADGAARHITFSPDALQALLRAPWPGNVRELELLIRSVAASPRRGTVTLDDLPIDVMHASDDVLTHLEQLEKQAILRSLRRTEGNKKHAAAELGISRSTLYRKLRSFGIDLDRSAF
jgi:sigma-54 dependent transcriptional regulator, acetoin dehydrogenase operon transcriptional activator AcoR